MKSCSNCEGEKISSTCVLWEGTNLPYESFNALIEAIYNAVFAEKQKIDLKTLSDNPKATLADAIQILIDKEVKRLNQSTSSSSSSTSSSCNINVSSLDGCSTCNKSFCEKLQLMVTEIATLRAEVNQLKTQL